MLNEEQLKNYLLDRLHNKTYRELLKDNEFIVQTGIKSLGTFTYYTKKLNINMEDVYERGKITGNIDKKLSYEDWTILTHRKNIVNKRKHKEKLRNNILQERKNILLNIAESIGLPLNCDDSENILYECLIPFIGQQELDKRLSDFPIN